MRTEQSSKGRLERGAAADLWRNTLSQIPSIFGRLVYLASLRDANTGRYAHHGLACLYSDEEADRILARSHGAAFAEWLNFPLEHQKADLDLYLSTLDSARRETVENWMRLTPYRGFMPARAREVEKVLYLSDLEALLALLKNEFGVCAPEPDA